MNKGLRFLKSISVYKDSDTPQGTLWLPHTQSLEMDIRSDPLNLPDMSLWSGCSLYLFDNLWYNHCLLWVFLWFKKKKDTKCKIHIQLTRHLRCIMPQPQLSNTSCWKDSLSSGETWSAQFTHVAPGYWWRWAGPEQRRLQLESQLDLQQGQ